MTPVHFFHYTPMGVAILLVQVGFVVIETGQFGSFHYESMLLGELATDKRWPTWVDLMRRNQQQNKNETDRDDRVKENAILNQEWNPDQVWILVQKPPEE